MVFWEEAGFSLEPWSHLLLFLPSLWSGVSHQANWRPGSVIMRLGFRGGQEGDFNNCSHMLIFLFGSLLLRFGSAAEGWGSWLPLEGRAGVSFWGNHLGDSREGAPAPSFLRLPTAQISGPMSPSLQRRLDLVVRRR